MNDKQTKHMEYILFESHRLIADKYQKGAAEHQSNLGEDYSAEQLVDYAIEEAIDQITYLITLKNKLDTKPHN